MIEVAHITKRYGGARTAPVIEDVSLCVRDGSIFGLVGYNGAGKTTLLKIIAGVYRPSAGEVRLDGRTGAPRPGELFIVADEPYFISQATPRTMGRFYRGYYPAWSAERYLKLLEVFGLDEHARIEGFSKGMARQCGIALGFASGARALLLDESFDGLDLAKRRLIKRLLKGYASVRNAAVLVTSHNLLEIEDIADDLGMIDGSRLVFSGSTEEIHRAHPNASLEEIFLAHDDGAGAPLDMEVLFGPA
ncbi:MAG: ABC transporter ATP-binding protein [Coriobacteriales bacterium]|jgi:ABC-2 type transport system ATP-binding protein|nr:ABC transporter ATP-binding protein [Coriobacteriales bacterium]